MNICCALVKRPDSLVFGTQCVYKAKYTTDDGLKVCKNHLSYTLEDKEYILKLVEEKKLLNIKKKTITELNDKLIQDNPDKIPLKDNDGQIIDFALVSLEDYENVNQYTWHKNDGYALGTINSVRIKMHHFILGKPEDEYVVDHINHNGLNNHRNNLRFATLSQNSQNRKKTQGTSSKYLGVYYIETSKKWRVSSSNESLGLFTDEIEAAKQYDTYVFLKYGPHAATNKLLNYDDIKDIDINTIIRKKPDRELPKNITLTNNKFIVNIQYKSHKFYKKTDTLKEAQNKLEEFEEKLSKIKEDEIEEHYKQPILRNADNQAIIIIKNKKNETIDEVLVDDDKWYDLMRHHWCKRDNYYISKIDGKAISLHRYLMNAKPNELVDHINNNGDTVKNNMMYNLRINDRGGNAHNRIKKQNTSSKYTGVSYDKKNRNWSVAIRKDHTTYNLGVFNKENDAALAYNAKAIELYKEFANLNIITS